MNNKQVYGRINPNRVLKFGWCICVLAALLVLQSCGIIDGSSSQVYILSTVNDVEVTTDKEVGIVGGMITLNKNGNIERKLNHRMQDGTAQQNVNEGTYKIKWNEIENELNEFSGYKKKWNELEIELNKFSRYKIKGNEVELKESILYRWSPPSGKLKGDTLIFYNPCVDCFGPPHEEVYVRR